MKTRSIVLDANISIRAVLGKRVRELIICNAASTQFFSPDIAWSDARKYLPAPLKKRGIGWGLKTRVKRVAILRACGIVRTRKDK